MHALIVTAHPLSTSLTGTIAAEVAAGIQADEDHSVEIADLAAEGFDPRFSAIDGAVHLRRAAIPADVAREQARIDRADALILVYPVYWWSFPALLKGWIDRVFSNGWAYDEIPGGSTVKKLQRLPVYLVAIGGADLGTYARRGYLWAMRTQIEHGIFDYCGARVITSELLLPPSDGDWTSALATARALGQRVFSQIRPAAASAA
jgi:NAD(P)H dehydrogenase (quinone)